MNTFDRTEINKKIKKLKAELAELENEISEKTGIKPSQTKELIEKYYGRCFRMEGYESGTVEFKLQGIHVHRDTETIDIVGQFIIYVTPDICMLDINKGLYISGGAILCEGKLDIDRLPYVDIDWESSIFEQLDYLFTHTEVSNDEFEKDIISIDEYADDFGFIRPLEEIKSKKNYTMEYEYNDVFGHL